MAVTEFAEEAPGDDWDPYAYQPTAEDEAFLTAELAKADQRTNGQHPADTEEAPSSSTWAPVEMPATLAGIKPKPPPTILTRDDGAALFYAASINGLHGESGEGKSWVAKLAAGEEMARGNHVVYVDHEDAFEQVAADLVALGFEYEQFRPFFHYIAPEEPLVTRQGKYTPGWGDYIDTLERYSPTLVVFDGITDGMNLHGLVPDANDDYATFKRFALDPAAKRGAAVVTIDHVTKNGGGGKGYAIGAQHKRAGMTGASYEVKAVTAFARGHDGMFKLVCRKAKRGHWTKGETVAECHVTSHEDGRLTIELRTPEAEDKSTEKDDPNWKPTYLMERCSAWLQMNPGEHSLTQVRDAVKGRGEWIDIALDRLVDLGHVDRRTAGQAKYHTHATRYYEPTDETEEGSP